MTINLDDNKLVKVVYQLNDKETIEFNYKEGELVSVIKEGETKPKGLTDREMMNTIKDSSFFTDLKNAKAKYNMAKEIADSIKENEMSPFSSQEMDWPIQGAMTTPYEDGKKEYSKEALDIAKRVIKQDTEGTLDLIAKKHRDEIDKSLGKMFKDEAKQDEIRTDIWSCEQSLHNVKTDILEDLETFQKGKDDEELLEKIEIYQYYLNKKKELEEEENKTWEKLSINPYEWDEKDDKSASDLLDSLEGKKS